MRYLFPTLLALACPVGMCLVPMLLVRFRGQKPPCAPNEVSRVESAEEVS